MSCGVSVSFAFGPDGSRSGSGFCPCTGFTPCEHAELEPVFSAVMVETWASVESDVPGEYEAKLISTTPEKMYDRCTVCGTLMPEEYPRCVCGHAEALHDDDTPEG